jgi:polyisoprenoid-binding protein YceI
MTRVQCRIAGLLVAGLFALPASAEEGGSPLTWRLSLDPAATEITFELGATLHTVRGRFTLRSGDLAFDPDTGAIRGRVVVDATSGDTGNERRDRVMHVDVLESARHPDFLLVPRAIADPVREADGLRGTLEATLSIRDTPHAIAIPIVARRTAAGRGEVSGSVEIPWVAWGMHDPSNFVLRVDKTLTVRFRAEGTLSSP